jgi:uncharacterized protein
LKTGRRISVICRRIDDPAQVLTVAGSFLESEPVLNNVVLTLLNGRIANPEAGRYWVAMQGETSMGVVCQSPLSIAATITPMKPEVVAAMADAIADSGVPLPGVNGEAGTTARFAGQWAERKRSAAVPIQGFRVYEAIEIADQRRVNGHLRRAIASDRDLLVAWVRGFEDDTGERARDPEVIVDTRLAAGWFWLWDDGGPVSMGVRHRPAAGVVRVSLVYTPPGKRTQGYAGACVGYLSKQILSEGYRCILYTDLGNPVSNSIYRGLGYRAVAECLCYRFG